MKRMISILFAAAIIFLLPANCSAFAAEDTSFDVESKAEVSSAVMPEYSLIDEDATIEYITSKLSADEFGGLYYEGDTLVVNVVGGPNIAVYKRQLPKKVADNLNIKYQSVTYSLQELENVKDFLMPYMYKYSINMLDANDVTNQVDIMLSDYSKENIKDITTLVYEFSGNVDYLNFIDGSKIKSVSTVAYEKPDKFADYATMEDTTASTESINFIYYSGMGIQIGNGYYTLGPAFSSTKAYSAGHGFGASATVKDYSGTTIGNAINHFGAATGDWSAISIYFGSASPVVGKATPQVGKAIHMIGSVSGDTSGTITRLHVARSIAPYVTLPDMCGGSYECASGDSGAGIFDSSRANLTSSSKTYGIQSSADFDQYGNCLESFFTPSYLVG